MGKDACLSARFTPGARKAPAECPYEAREDLPLPRPPRNSRAPNLGGGDMTGSKQPAFTWAFEEGRLTVTHLGKKVPLGRYADRALAAKAAARYLAEHGGPAPAASE
jgi:hypothetical protein